MGGDTQEDIEARRRAAELLLLERLLDRLEEQRTAPPEILTAIRSEVSAGIAEGIATALANPDNVQQFWGAAVNAMQDAATKKAGVLVLSGLSAGGKRLVGILVLVVLMWSYFGWSGMAAAWNALVAAKGVR
jgi:hypothetical protein